MQQSRNNPIHSYLLHTNFTFESTYCLSMALVASQSLIRFLCNFPSIHFSFLNPLHCFLISYGFISSTKLVSSLLFLFCSPVSICFRFILSALVLSFLSFYWTAPWERVKEVSWHLKAIHDVHQFRLQKIYMPTLSQFRSQNQIIN